MNNLVKTGVGGLVVAASIAALATPAEARRYYRHHRGGDDAAIAIGAGLIGLGIGAAIANDRGRYYDPYYNRRYYDRGYYDRSYYNRGYYAPRYRGGYHGRYGGYGRDCYTRRVYDPYLGRRVRVRYCD